MRQTFSSRLLFYQHPAQHSQSPTATCTALWAIKKQWHWPLDTQLGEEPIPSASVMSAGVVYAENIGSEPAGLHRLSLNPFAFDGRSARHQPNGRLGRKTAPPMQRPDAFVMHSRQDNLPNTGGVAFRFDPVPFAAAICWMLEVSPRPYAFEVAARELAERLWVPLSAAGLYSEV